MRRAAQPGRGGAIPSPKSMSAPPISRPVGMAFPPRRSSLPSPHLRLRCRRRTTAPKGARRRRVDCRHEAVDVGNGGAAVHVHRLLGGTPPEAGVAGAGLALHEQASARRPVGPMRRAERAGMYALVGRGGGRLIRGGGRDRLARLCCCRCLGRCRKGAGVVRAGVGNGAGVVTVVVEVAAIDGPTAAGREGC